MTNHLACYEKTRGFVHCNPRHYSVDDVQDQDLTWHVLVFIEQDIKDMLVHEG